MAAQKSQLILPPAEEEVIYPYRRVWLSIGIESGILFALTVTIVIAWQVISLPEQYWLPLALLLALTPLILWGFVSWGRESSALQPRRRLLPVLIITMLTANALGYPLVNEWLQVNDWAMKQGAVGRIVVFALAFGTLPEVLKYLVVRYTVWLDTLRDRYDALAYCATTAVGYVTVLNLHYVLAATPPPDVAAIRIFGTTALQLASSLIIAYAIAEMRFDRPSPLLMPGMISLASFVTGLVITLRGNIANTRVSSLIQVNEPRLLFNLVISAMVLIAISLAMVFLFSTIERQVAEAQQETDL